MNTISTTAAAAAAAAARLLAARSSALPDAEGVGWVCACNEWWSSATAAGACVTDGVDTCTACRPAAVARFIVTASTRAGGTFSDSYTFAAVSLEEFRTILTAQGAHNVHEWQDTTTAEMLDEGTGEWSTIIFTFSPVGEW